MVPIANSKDNCNNDTSCEEVETEPCTSTMSKTVSPLDRRTEIQRYAEYQKGYNLSDTSKTIVYGFETKLPANGSFTFVCFGEK
jgi:hypothetical protein